MYKDKIDARLGLVPEGELLQVGKVNVTNGLSDYYGRVSKQEEIDFIADRLAYRYEAISRGNLRKKPI